MEEFDVGVLLKGLDDRVRKELDSMPEVVDVGDDLDLDDLAVEARRWARVDEIVAVVADLKNSTQLGTGKQKAASTASIYESAIRPLVETYVAFDADDVAIQGDGAVAIFWGEHRFQRAICAGITVKTFSETIFGPRLEAKWDELPPTGFKVGVAASRILVKRVGIPRTEHKEELWAGRAVNYAAKAAQSADRHQLIVTDTVWQAVEHNDFITYSCDCGNGPRDTIWESVEIERLPEEEPDRYGRRLLSRWCEIHGATFCAAIMAGETQRPGLRDQVRDAHRLRIRTDALRKKAQEARERRRSLSQLRGSR